MTPQEFAALLDYIRENNSWGVKMYELSVERNRRVVKYVDASFDSRDGHIWQITFRSCLPDGTKDFRVESGDDVAKIYTWLDAPAK